MKNKKTLANPYMELVCKNDVNNRISHQGDLDSKIKYHTQKIK